MYIHIFVFNGKMYKLYFQLICVYIINCLIVEFFCTEIHNLKIEFLI